MKKSLFFSDADQWITGLTRHETSLALIRIPSGVIQSALGNAQLTELEFQAARAATLAASNHLIEARSRAVPYVETTRTALRLFLGKRWSTAWTQVGFTNRSLQILKNTPGVLSLLWATQSYLTRPPAHQTRRARRVARGVAGSPGGVAQGGGTGAGGG